MKLLYAEKHNEQSNFILSKLNHLFNILLPISTHFDKELPSVTASGDETLHSSVKLLEYVWYSLILCIKYSFTSPIARSEADLRASTVFRQYTTSSKLNTPNFIGSSFPVLRPYKIWRYSIFSTSSKTWTRS